MSDPVARGARRAQVMGTGLVGASVGRALRERGWHVSGVDDDPAAAEVALGVGAIDVVGWDADAEICFVAVPVSALAGAVTEALERTGSVVTDVGSVKAPVVAEVVDPRFVAGHPMAGSEQDGAAGADGSMFEGAVWVLAPGPRTSPEAQALVHSVVSSMGAEVLTLDAAEHDRLVAMVSHVPHLTAAALMRLATARATEQSALLRLAAGGFRDMTRIAAGRPSIWPDICAENRDAIVGVLDDLVAELSTVRDRVAAADRDALLGGLEAARSARLNLPTTAPRAEDLVELRIGVSDEPGQLARITTLATELSVNIYDIEIAHSAEGPRGVVILLVGTEGAAPLARRLSGDGFAVARRELQ